MYNIPRYISILFLCYILYACGRTTNTVCGVLVQGTPWEFAAAIADKGDGSFIPESVDVSETKAYIKGWVNTNVTNQPYTTEPYDDGFLPAKIWCDVVDGHVTHALLYCEILDKE